MNWPYSSPAATLGRAGPAPPLSSLVELTLCVEVVGELAQEWECGRAGLAYCLLCNGIYEGEIFFLLFCPHHLQ